MLSPFLQENERGVRTNSTTGFVSFQNQAVDTVLDCSERFINADGLKEDPDVLLLKNLHDFSKSGLIAAHQDHAARLRRMRGNYLDKFAGSAMNQDAKAVSRKS